MGAMDVVARFDDLQTGRALVMRRPADVAVATTLEEVRPLIERAEAAARSGQWVALVVTYEAGPAFEPAQGVHPPEPGLPLAWMAAADAVEDIEAVSAVRVPADVVGVHRRGGSEWYGRSVGAVREIIASGSAYQINLTDRLDGILRGSPFDLYARMALAQRSRFNAFVDLGEHIVVSASPELFFEVKDGVVTSRPMKGTERRSARPEDDAAVARRLANSEKDRAENVMITDLLRNDIGRIARVGSVRVPSLLRMERYETVWQLTSTVTGEIDDDVSLLTLFDALFPCGSITGAPKISAMHHITRLEAWPRGVYCGAIGILRPSSSPDVRPHATFSVAIRTAVVRSADGTLTYGAGGGITADSDGDAENRELEAKSAVLATDRREFGLLETMRAEDGVVAHLDLHLARLSSSAFHFGFEVDVEHVRALCERLARTAVAPHRLRLVLQRDGGVTTSLDPIDMTGDVVRLAVCTEPVDSHDAFMVHKTTRRDLYERIAASRPDADDVILVNSAGDVVETCRANILFRVGDRWCTPPTSSGGLPGVGRAALLRSGEVEERVLPLTDLRTVDELHVVSGLRGRRPAVVVD